MRQLISAVAIILLAFAFYFFSQKKTNPSSSETADESFLADSVSPKPSPDTAGGVSGDSSMTQTNGQSSDSTQAASLKTADEPTFSPISQWITSESAVLNTKGVDPKAKDSELKRKIEVMSNEEKDFLIRLAHDTNRSATDRILAAYMLILDPTKDSGLRLAALATKDVPDFGPINAHSEAELRRNQELAIRYMAIDQLVEKTKNGDNEARDELKKIAETAPSEQVRAYAKRYL